jgi:hypothetical protein
MKQKASAYFAEAFSGCRETLTVFYFGSFVQNIVLCIQMDRSFPLQVLAFRGEEVKPPRRCASVGSRLFLYIPQESSTFRSNPLFAFNIDKSTNLLEKSLYFSITLKKIAKHLARFEKGVWQSLG